MAPHSLVPREEKENIKNMAKKTHRDSSRPLADSPTPPPTDSTAYYAQKEYVSKLKALAAQTKPEMDMYFKEADQAKQDRYRQNLKGKKGYDKNGFPIK